MLSDSSRALRQSWVICCNKALTPTIQDAVELSLTPSPSPSQPCDEEWTENPVYKKECQDQNIVRQRTKYMWEMRIISDDVNHADEFLQFGFENILAPPNQRYLPPAHMFPDRYVRCRVTAVDSSGIEGYTRVSQPVKLVHNSQDACPADVKVSVTATLKLAGDGTPTLEVRT